MEIKPLNDLRIKKAKKILVELFNIDIFYLENNTNRKSHIIEARRFLIYYMNRELLIPYNRIKDYIKNLHHCTALHHCKKLEELFPQERWLREKYHKFYILANDFDMLAVLLKLKRDKVNYYNSEIKAINKQLKEKRHENNSKSTKDFRAANRNF